MTISEIISWLLEGDVSIQYQTCRDLLNAEKPELRKKIDQEGWGRNFLNYRKPDGHWGKGFYQPKWTSTHYTLLNLKNLSIDPENGLIRDSVRIILENEKASDGGINPSGTIKNSDVCINGMVLNYACYFNLEAELLKSIVDFLLSQKMIDGGFNCHSNRKGANHSSLHTTLSVLEGIHEYESNGYTYRLNELMKAKQASREFILMHRLFRSDKTGISIKSKFLQLSYPGYWFYDILKAMDYFRLAGVGYDSRMCDAIEIISGKRTKEGRWKLASKHPGQTHFEMETSGEPSRWNTLRALRVLKYYGIHN